MVQKIHLWGVIWVPSSRLMWADKLKKIDSSSVHILRSPCIRLLTEQRWQWVDYNGIWLVVLVVSFLFQSCLTLIGMRQGTFHPLSFLDQTLSAEFLPKISKLFWRWKLTSIAGLIWHPDKLIESYKKCGAKDQHFSCSKSSCQLGLKVYILTIRSKIRIHMHKYTLLFSEPVKKLPKGYRHSDSEDSESESEEPRGRGRPKASSKSKYLLN